MSERSTDSDDEANDTDTVTPASHSSSTWKVLGEIDDVGATGVLGHNTATSGESFGVTGYSDSAEDFTAGVYGEITAGPNTGATNGVYGTDPTVDGAGVFGESTVSSGEAYGVYGLSESPEGYGVYSLGDSLTTGNHEVEGYVQAQNGFRGDVGATVHLSSDQSISDTARVAYDSVEGDDRDEYDTRSNEFVCAYDGDYHVHATAEPGTVPEGDRVVLEIFTDGSTREAQTRRFGPPGGARISVSVSKTLKDLSASTSIYIRFKNRTSASSLTLDGLADSTYLSITQVG